MLGSEVPQGWPPGEYDEGAQRYFLERLSQGGADVIGWYVLLRQIFHEGGSLIASGGFLGPPNETGEVEIGYSVHEDWQGNGYATELVGELVQYAFEDTRVRRIVAHTTRQNLASCRVLEHLGFCDCGISSEGLTVQYELIRG